MAEITTLGAPIKQAYEGEANTNAFTDAEKTKLAGLPSEIDADAVGLGNVDNTSDADKPISDATQAALDAKLSDIAGLIDEGDNVTITGSGTDEDPFVISASGGGGITLQQASSYANGNLINALDFGFVADGKVVSGSSTTVGSNVVTFSSGRPADLTVGKLIAVKGAGTSATQSLSGYVGAISTNTVTVMSAPSGGTAINAGVAVSNAQSTYGSPNGTALQNALNAAIDSAPAKILLPEGMAIIESYYTWASYVSLEGRGKNVSILKFISPTDQAAAIFQLIASNSNPSRAMEFRNFGLDTTDANFASYSVSRKHFFFQFHVNTVIENLSLIGSIASCVGIDQGVDCRILNNDIYAAGRGNPGNSAGGAGIGIGTTNTNITVDGVIRKEKYLVQGNFVYDSKRYGIFFETQEFAHTYADVLCVDNIITQLSGSGTGIADCGNVGSVYARNILKSPSTSASGIFVGRGTITQARPGLELKIYDNYVEGFRVGINLDYTYLTVQPGPVDTILKNNVIKGASANGIQITLKDNAAYTLSGFYIEGNIVTDCSQYGLRILEAALATNVSIKNNTFARNGKGTASRSALSLNANCTHIDIIGNWLYDDQAVPTQAYGLEVASGKIVQNGLLDQNHFYGNATSPALITGTMSLTTGTNVGYP